VVWCFIARAGAVLAQYDTGLAQKLADYRKKTSRGNCRHDLASTLSFLFLAAVRRINNTAWRLHLLEDKK
jgi:hypothetical protein